MSKVNYEVVILDESSIEQQVKVFKQAFNLMDEDALLVEYWRKKHYLNPICKSLIFGIFEGGELIGMNAFIPSTYNYKGKVVKCLQSCESGVIPDYQGKGVWGTIVQYAENYIFSNTDFEIIFGFPNYRNSYKGFVKMGWKTVGHMYNYILINNPRKFSRIFIKNDLISFFSLPLYLQKIPLLFWKSSKFEVKECKPEELIWEKENNSISVMPSVEYVKWKIDYKNEKILALKRNGETIATCIYVLDKFKGHKVIRLDRITVNPHINIQFKVVLSNIISYVSKLHSDAAFIRIWSTKESECSNASRKLFFLKSSHPNPFILRSSIDEYLKTQWKLSFYDLD